MIHHSVSRKTSGHRKAGETAIQTGNCSIRRRRSNEAERTRNVPSYFLIMPIPDEVKNRLVAVQPHDLPGVSLAGRQAMHLTLYSLGELSSRYDEAIRQALAQVKANAFTITISGVGRFQLGGEPQLLWQGSRAARRYSHCINRLAPPWPLIGFRREERPYVPHICPWPDCIRPARPMLWSNLEDNKGFVVPSVPLDCFALYSSIVVDGGAKISEERRFLSLEMNSHSTRGCLPQLGLCRTNRALLTGFSSRRWGFDWSRRTRGVPLPFLEDAK